MNKTGGLNWGVVIAVPVFLLLLIVIVPIIDVFVQNGFIIFDATQGIYYSNILKLVIGSFGLIMVLGALYVIVSSIRGPDVPPPYYG